MGGFALSDVEVLYSAIRLCATIGWVNLSHPGEADCRAARLSVGMTGRKWNDRSHQTKPYVSRADKYTDDDEYDPDIADCNEVVRLDPEYVRAYVSRGNAYGLKGDFDRAIESLGKAIELDPNDADAYINRAIAYLHKDDRIRAIADLEKASSLSDSRL